MEHHRDKGKTPDPNSQAQTGEKTTSKRPYVSPVLVEYGTIAKLTQGSGTKHGDGRHARKGKHSHE
jgi:hypothetical protein